MKSVIQLADEILKASPEAQQTTSALQESTLPEMSDEQRNSMIGLTESNARITAKKAMRGESPTNAREKRAVRAKLDKSDSKAKKVPLDVAAAAYEGVSIPSKKFQSIDDALNPVYSEGTKLKSVVKESTKKSTPGKNSLSAHEISVLREAVSIMKRFNESTTVGAIGTGALKPLKGKVSLLKNNKKKKSNESFNRFLGNIINEVKSN